MVKVLAALACAALLCGLLPLLPGGTQARADGGIKYFTLLHTNDEHSEVIPADVSIDFPTYPTTGGFSRIAHEIARIEAEKAATGEPVLVTNSGDFSQGTLFAWLETNAATELSLMQGIGYDAVALGNHEFDEGAGYRATALGQAKALGVTLPVLCSNIHFDDTNPEAAALHALWSEEDKGGTELAIQPYTVKTLSNGLKVGFFGLMGVEAEAVAPMAAKTGVTFGNVIDPETGLPEEEESFLRRVFTAQDMINTLRGKGCEVVVCLSHMGTTEELMLTQYVSGLDVILGGHSHDLDYPPIIKNGVIYAQAGAYSKYLGELELAYDPDAAGPKVSLRYGQAIDMDDRIPTVPAVDAIIANYVAALNGLTGMDIMAPLAETDIDGDGGFNLSKGPDFCESNLGDLITDAYQSIATAVNPAEPVDFGIEANGVIRSGIPKGGRGVFDFYDLHRVVPLGATPDATQAIPFGNPLCAFYLYGAEILGAMETILGMDSQDFFPQISADARCTYRPAAHKDHKLVSLEVFDQESMSWQPINPSKLYKVATNLYTTSFLELFGLTPRTSTGAPTTAMDSRVMDGPNEVKAWQALLQYVLEMPDMDGDGLPNIVPFYRHPAGRLGEDNWNMAEGSSEGGMETFVLVQNPGDTPVHVNVKFNTGSGEVAPATLQGYEIPAKSRETFKANDFVGSYDVSARVESIDGFVVCERSVFGDGRSWATDSVAVTAPAPSGLWYLPEGCTEGGMETFVLVQNPYSEAVHVDITFQTSSGPVSPTALQGVAIPAKSRRTFKVNDYVTDWEVSTTVEATDGQVVCERSMFGNGRAWATDSIGAIPPFAPSGRWLLAEGCAEGGMETWVLVQNPGDMPVHVNLKFQTGSGEVVPAELQGVAIPARSRESFKVNDYVTDWEVSTTVEATDGQVVCERSMFGGGGAWATDTIGATASLGDWFLAEGCTEGGMETFVLVQNPNDGEAMVNISFQTSSGEVAPADLQGVIVPARSRRTFKVNDYVTDWEVSTRVRTFGGSVVCERSMFGNSRSWATASIGYAR